MRKITRDDLDRHRNESWDGNIRKATDRAHDGEFTWWAYDAQGCELAKVCDLCEEAALAGYRPEILTGYTQADVDEPIEPEDY
jgi:hypothetical protein